LSDDAGTVAAGVMAGLLGRSRRDCLLRRASVFAPERAPDPVRHPIDGLGALRQRDDIQRHCVALSGVSRASVTGTASLTNCPSVATKSTFPGSGARSEH